MKKITDHIRKNKGLLAGYFCIACMIGVAMIIMYRTEIHDALQQPRSVMTVKAGMTGTGAALALTGEERVEQEISIVDTVLTGFSVWFDSMQAGTEGKILVQLKNPSGRIVESWRLDAAEVDGGGFYRFYIPEMQTCVGETYTVSVAVNMEQNRQILLGLVNINDTRGRNVLLHEVKTDGGTVLGEQEKEAVYSLSYEIYHGDCGALKYYYMVIAAGIFFLLAILYLMLVLHREKEWIFAVAAFLLGSMYLLILPPYAVPDESAHFVTAYVQSSEILGRTAEDENGMVLLEPEAAGFLARRERPDRGSYASYIRGIFQKEENVTSQTVPGRGALDVRYLGYVPQVAGLCLGRILHVNGTWLFILGRLGALLIYCFLMFWAVRLMPDFGKNILFLAGILPVTLQQAASYSYDSILNAALFFLTAYILYLAYDDRKERLCWKDYVLLLFPILVFVPIKFIYMPLLGLGLFIPEKKFGGRKKKAVAGSLAVFSCILLLFVTRMQNIIHTAVTSGSPGTVKKTYTLMECLRDPVHTGVVFFKTIEQSLSYYLESMIGTPLGWLEIIVPNIIVYGFALLLLLSLLQKADARQWKFWNRVWMVLLWGGISFLVCLALLLDWTEKNSPVIQGVQGRYFIPVLPLLLLSLQNQAVVLKKRLDAFLISAAAALHAATILSVVSAVVSR